MIFFFVERQLLVKLNGREEGLIRGLLRKNGRKIIGDNKNGGFYKRIRGNSVVDLGWECMNKVKIGFFFNFYFRIGSMICLYVVRNSLVEGKYNVRERGDNCKNKVFEQIKKSGIQYIYGVDVLDIIEIVFLQEWQIVQMIDCLQ